MALLEYRAMIPAIPYRRALLTSALILGRALSVLPATADAHGSVTNEDDLCAIEIGYLRAHFKIYLPQRHGHDEFCEDLPATGESVFVMEYVHRDLGDIPLDFRIVRNVTGMGRFARLADVEAIGDLDAVTELYLPPARRPDVFTVLHRFEEPGEFIGVVTAMPAGAGEPLRAVFPFEVGFTGFGVWPLFLALAVALQLHYLYMSGRFPFRRRDRVQAVSGGRGSATA